MSLRNRPELPKHMHLKIHVKKTNKQKLFKMLMEGLDTHAYMQSELQG